MVPLDLRRPTFGRALSEVGREASVSVSEEEVDGGCESLASIVGGGESWRMGIVTDGMVEVEAMFWVMIREIRWRVGGQDYS